MQRCSQEMWMMRSHTSRKARVRDGEKPARARAASQAGQAMAKVVGKPTRIR